MKDRDSVGLTDPRQLGAVFRARAAVSSIQLCVFGPMTYTCHVLNAFSETKCTPTRQESVG